LVIIAEGFSAARIKTLATTVQVIRDSGDTRLIEYLAIKAPSLTTEQFEDVAVFCNAKFFNKNLTDNNLTKARAMHLGFAKKVIASEDEIIITGTTGNVTERVELLKSQLEIEKDSAFAEQIKRRIGSLQSGLGIIRVGASTEPERKYIKYKIEDAVNAAKAALEEGVLPGGGIVLKEIAEELGPDNILYPALIAPHERIMANAGPNLKIGKTILDPFKVTRYAVENACSVAAQLITAESAIANQRKTLWGEMEKKLAPRDEMDDFRDDENQGQKF
jgi:chaperonin GroEL